MFATVLILLRVASMTMVTVELSQKTDQDFSVVYALSRTATLCKYIILLQVSGSQFDFCFRLKANVQIAVSNGSRHIILNNRVKRQRSIFILYSLIALLAALVGGAVIKWERNKKVDASNTTLVVLSNIFLAIVVALLAISYTFWLRVVSHYFYGDLLTKERNRFALVYGMILILTVAQALYFEAIQKNFFCQSY